MVTYNLNPVAHERYATAELKEYINKNTLRGFLSSLSVLVAGLILYSLISSTKTILLEAPIIPVSRNEVTNISIQSSENKIITPINIGKIFGGGTYTRAGNPVPVPVNDINNSLSPFAGLDELNIASSNGNPGATEIGNYNENFTIKNTSITKSIEKEVIPKFDEFVALEEYPTVADLSALQRSVKYPEMAIKARVEGKVIVAVYIDKYGRALKAIIVNSPNSLLDKASLEAVLSYKGYKPGIQNGKSVGCWLQMPINFKLK